MVAGFFTTIFVKISHKGGILLSEVVIYVRDFSFMPKTSLEYEKRC